MVYFVMLRVIQWIFVPVWIKRTNAVVPVPPNGHRHRWYATEIFRSFSLLKGWGLF